MQKKHAKVIIVMPAFNSAATVNDTYSEIPKQYRDTVILVDDKSTDNTIAVAKKLGIKTIAHPKNLGYGGNQKTCYKEALKHHPEVVIMIHADYQYDATKIPQMIEPILSGKKDFMFGSRMLKKEKALTGGMPITRYILNKIFCKIENTMLGVELSEHFSGMRAYSSKVLQTIPFQHFSNDFVFDQQMEIAAISYGFRIGETPIPTRYHEKASSINFLKGTKFLLNTLYYLCLFKLHQTKLIQSNLFLQNA